MLQDFLTTLGLSEKESKIYLALLEVDHEGVGDISKRTKINRTTVYPVLEQLIEKKLVKEIEVKGKARYKALSPDRLETFVERQRLSLDEKARELQQVLPRLRGVAKTSGQLPVVEFYEGRKTMLDAMKRYLDSEDNGATMYTIYPRDTLIDFFSSKEIEAARRIRIDRNIESSAIYTSKEVYAPGENKTPRRHVDSKKYPVSAEISIYKDRVRMHSLGDTVNTILIHNKDIAETLQTLFRLAFDNLKND